MGIRTELDRIKGAKAALKTAIEGKGVTVLGTTKLDGYAALVDSIVDNGLKITEFDVDMNPTKVEVLGDTIWRRAFASSASGTYPWQLVTEISAPNVTFVAYNGIINMSSLLHLYLPHVTTLSQSAIVGNHALTNISLPELLSAEQYAIYNNSNVETYYFPKCTTTSGLRPMGFATANTSLVSAQLGSIGYPVTALSVGTFYNATSASLVITVYVTPGSQPLAGSPWNATNATIVYRSAVDGSVL